MFRRQRLCLLAVRHLLDQPLSRVLTHLAVGIAFLALGHVLTTQRPFFRWYIDPSPGLRLLLIDFSLYEAVLEATIEWSGGGAREREKPPFAGPLEVSRPGSNLETRD